MVVPIINLIDKWSCRQFDPRTTLSQLRAGGMNKVMCWGMENVQQWKNKSLIFDVKGLLFKGTVVITLDVMDTYEIHYLDSDGNEKLEANYNVYCDELTDVIDNKIERKTQ